MTGTITAGALTVSGDIDVGGTTNLDAVDIDAAVDMASTLAVGGVVTANAGVVVDNITIDGTEIDLSSGTLTLDSAGDISLQAGSGGERLLISNSTGDVILRTADRYVYSNASSGGTTIDVGLRFESATPKLEFWVNDGERASISSDGSLTVTHDVKLPDSGELVLGADGDLKLYHNNSHAFIKNITGDLNIENNSSIYIDSTHDIILDAAGSNVTFKDNTSTRFDFLLDATPTIEISGGNFTLENKTDNAVMYFKGLDSGASVTALTLDMANAGAATFNAGVTLGGVGAIDLADGVADNAYALIVKNKEATDDRSYGLLVHAGSTSTDRALVINDHDGSNALFYVTGAGFAGIQTTAPKRHLHINGGNESVKLQITNTTTGSSSDGDGFQVGIATDGTANLEQRENAGMVFSTNNSPRMTIDSSGNVGIGVTPETAWSGFTALQVGAGVALSGGTGTDELLLTANVYYDGSNYKRISNNHATIYQQSDASHRFFVNGAGTPDAAFTPSEAMRIDSSGRVGIGTADFASLDVDGHVFIPGSNGYAFNRRTGTDNSANLYIARANDERAISFYRNDGTLREVGKIELATSSTSYTTSSDYRLKENVVDLTNATSRLKQLKPKRFNFIIDADTTIDGFLAHEVSSIVPEAVVGKKDAVKEDGSINPQGIDPSKLVPLLVKTIQELEARITALEAG